MSQQIAGNVFVKGQQIGSEIVNFPGTRLVSTPYKGSRFRPVGDQLIFTEDRTTPATCANSIDHDIIIKMENDPAGIVGVWALGSATTIKTQHFAFFSDGKLLMVDPLGDTEGNNCGGPGVESGTYTY